MDILNKKLSKLGLKDKEVEIYLSILTLGKGNITDISKKSKIKRTSIYQYIENLLKENLIYQTIVKKRIFYIAENPKKIIRLLENKRSDLENKKRDIKKIIPELEDLYLKHSSKPNINFYEGEEGLKFVYEEMVLKQKNIYSFFSPKKFFEIFSHEENDKFLMKLYENGGILYNLVEKSDKAIRRLKIDKYNKFVKNKILPEDFKFDTDILIGKDVVAFISFDNLVAVIIKDGAIANLQKNIFKMIWNGLK